MRRDGLDLFVVKGPAWHPPVYKFLNQKYVDALLTRGSVRLGTSAEYRVPDGLDDGRSDASEAVTRWAPGPREIVMDQEHPFIKGLFGDKPRPEKSTMIFEEGARIIINARAYIFSTSNQYTDDLAKKMAEKFDADACVRIEDPRAFMVALSKSSPLKDRPFYQSNVSYVDSVDVVDYRGTDAFLKLRKFEWQKEFRTIWGGNDIPETGSVIEEPGIIPFLSRV